jgi:hypothetical protein
MPDPDERDGGPAEDVQIGEAFEIANEFAIVRIRRVLTRNGERLEIYSPKLGTRIHVDAVELESISWQTHDTFSKFLETPFGPEAA